MKTDFYLIRHGNIDMAKRVPGRIAGIHLSKEGIEQIRMLAKSIAKLKIDVIYTSPLERTVETAHLLAENRSIEIINCESLIEIDFGEWSGKKFQELESDLRWKQFHYYRNGTIIPNGELMIEIEARVVKLIESLFKKHPNKKIVIVSHNDPIKSIIAHYLGISLDLFNRITITTASLSILTMYKDWVEIKGINLKKLGKARF